MNKKIFGIFIFLLIVVYTSSFVSSAIDIEIESNNKLWNNKRVNNNGCCEDFNPFIMRDPPVDLDPHGIYDSPKPSSVETPEYFNWRDYNGEDWVTCARAQGWCGSCWAFAALGIIESVVNIEEECSYLNPDLSEQYVLSCLSKAGRCFGGKCDDALEYIIDTSEDGNYHNGIISESCFPYIGIDPFGCDFFGCGYEPVLCSEKCDNWEDLLVPLVSYGTWHSDPEDNELIKAQIMESGPIAVPMEVIPEFTQWLMTHHDPDDYFPYPGDVSYTNHEIMIVGWKDDPSIGNGGYWICKNSWGIGFGYDGFFNIEYGSLNVDDSKVVYVEYDPESYNWPPVANANGLYYGSVGEEITFDGSDSFDAEGDIISYSWDFGDETVEEGAIVSHSYSEKGIYLVTLNVTDENYTIGLDTTWAFIDETNEAPNKPVITGPTKGTNRTWYNYTFLTSDSEINDVYYYIDWGDGFVDEWIGPCESGEELTLKHYWYFRGKYTIKVKAKDIYNYESEWGLLKVNIPRNKIKQNSFFLQFLQKLLNAFPILQHILR